jgi:hypothetical protein
MGCDMTLPALLLSMLSDQGKARLRQVVELLAVQANERSCQSLMFLVTAPAIRFANRALVGARVKPRLSFHPALDLGVTLQTLETTRGGSKFVARHALRQPFQLLVSA